MGSGNLILIILYHIIPHMTFNIPNEIYYQATQ